MTREVFELKYPFSHGGEEFTSFSLRRPKVRDIRKAEKAKDEMDKIVGMISDLAEVSTQVVDELDPEDFQVVADWVGEVLGGSGEDKAQPDTAR